MLNNQQSLKHRISMDLYIHCRSPDHYRTFHQDNLLHMCGHQAAYLYNNYHMNLMFQNKSYIFKHKYHMFWSLYYQKIYLDRDLHIQSCGRIYCCCKYNYQIYLLNTRNQELNKQNIWIERYKQSIEQGISHIHFLGQYNSYYCINLHNYHRKV